MYLTSLINAIAISNSHSLVENCDRQADRHKSDRIMVAFLLFNYGTLKNYIIASVNIFQYEIITSNKNITFPDIINYVS